MTRLDWDKARHQRSRSDASWRSLPPTRKQLDYLGLIWGQPEYANGRTRGEISDLIAKLREVDQRRAMEARRAGSSSPRSRQ